jgi:hypothetical protein
MESQSVVAKEGAPPRFAGIPGELRELTFDATFL